MWRLATRRKVDIKSESPCSAYKSFQRSTQQSVSHKISGYSDIGHPLLKNSPTDFFSPKKTDQNTFEI
jgi:hypothetical protein